MKRKSLLVAFLLSFGVAAALAQAPPPRPPSPEMPSFMHGWHPPSALMGDWWNNPEIANELRLTDAQKKQLEQVSTNFKLAMIDAGAAGLRAYVRLKSQLDADQVDKAVFSQELDAGSAAAARLVKDVGQAVLSVRTILTADQWNKLQAMHAAGHMRFHGHMEGPHDMHGDMHERMHGAPPPKPAPPRTPPK